MKTISLLISILFFTGCASLEPIEKPPQELHSRIANGELIQVGDKIKVITFDGKGYTFIVAKLTDSHIYRKKSELEKFNDGQLLELAIKDIATIDVAEHDTLKSALVIPAAIATIAILFVLSNK